MPKMILLGNTDVKSVVGKKNKELGDFISKYYPGSSVNTPIALTDKVLWCGQVALPNNAQDVTLIARSKLSVSELAVLPRINHIVAQSPREANSISSQVQAFGYKVSVISLPPWTPSFTANLTDAVGYLSLSPEYSKLLVEWKMMPGLLNGQMYCHLTKDQHRWPYEMFQALANGVPVLIDSNQLGADYIINYHVGYLINSGSNLNSSLNHFKKNQRLVSTNASNYFKALFEPTKYLKTLLDPSTSYNYNNQLAKTEYNERNWIIRRKMLTGSEIQYFPGQVDSNFRLIELNGLHEVLEYFNGKLFGEVYVFEDDLPEWFKITDINILKTHVFKLGKQSKKIHFCTDKSVPELWAPIFKHVSIISVEEGLKQVSG